VEVIGRGLVYTGNAKESLLKSFHRHATQTVRSKANVNTPEHQSLDRGRPEDYCQNYLDAS